MRYRLCDGSSVYYARDGAKDGANALANATFALLMKFALINDACQFYGVNIRARRAYWQTTNCRKLKASPIVHERRNARAILRLVSRFLID